MAKPKFTSPKAPSQDNFTLTKHETLNAIADDSNETMILASPDHMPSSTPQAKFNLGACVKHRFFAFRGIIFDVDTSFNNSEEWYLKIPENIRPKKDQPFYHLLAENEDGQHYFAYVSEQNLIIDQNKNYGDHDSVKQLFTRSHEGEYRIKQLSN